MAVVLLGLCALSFAAEVHVSVNGDDTASCGMDSTPCQSVKHALTRSVAHDTVMVRNGTYRGVANSDISFPSFPISIASTEGSVHTIIDLELFGGGWRVQGSSVQISGLTIRNAITGGDGGGLALYDADATLTDVVFSMCHADGFGGALFADKASTVNLENVSFLNCSAHDGGAVSVATATVLHASRCLFDECAAARYGGSLYVDGAMCAVASSSFANNHVERMGGAVFISNGEFELTSTSVTGSCDDYGYQIGCQGECSITKDSKYPYVCQPDPECGASPNDSSMFWVVLLPVSGCVAAAVCCTAAVLRAVRQQRVTHNYGEREATARDALVAHERRAKEKKERYAGLGDGYGPVAAVNGEKGACNICFENQVDCVLLECGHAVSCGVCAKKIDQCPMCRDPVVRVVRIFAV